MKSIVLFSLLYFFSFSSFAEKIYEGTQCIHFNETLSFEANTKTNKFLITNIFGQNTEWVSILNPWRIVEKDEYKILAKTNFRKAYEKAGFLDQLLLQGASLISMEVEIDINSNLIWIYAKVDPSYFSNNYSRRAVDHFVRQSNFLPIKSDSVNIASLLYNCGNVEVIKDFEEEERIKLEAMELEKRKDKLILLGSGTGFYVSEDGYLITNYHVVHGCKEIRHNKKNLEMIITDPVTDIAVLKSDSPPPNYIPLSISDALRADEIYVIGYPYGKGISSESKTTKGIVSSLQGAENNYAEFQIDAAIQPGNSGGPIVNEDGFLVGIVVSGVNYLYVIEELNSMQPPQNFNFGIKVSMLKNILDSNEIKYTIGNTSLFESFFSLNSNEKIKNSINSTAYLECIGLLSDTSENKISEYTLMKNTFID